RARGGARPPSERRTRARSARWRAPRDRSRPACRGARPSRAWRSPRGLGPGEALHEVFEVAHLEALGPLGALGVLAERLGHVDDRLAPGLEEPPDVTGAAADPPQVEDRIGGRLRLVGRALTEAVGGDPGHGD